MCKQFWLLGFLASLTSRLTSNIESSKLSSLDGSARLASSRTVRMLLVQASKLLTQLVALPFLILGSIPLLILSVLTMSMAFFVLSLRLLLVYVDFFIAVFQPNMRTLSSKTSSEFPLDGHRSGIDSVKSPSRPPNMKPNTSTRLIPSASAPASRRGSISNSFAGSVSMFRSSQDRDFEGIGGWRSPEPNASGDMEDDGTWLSFNKRLELPSPVYYTGTTTSSASIQPSLGLSSRGIHRRTPTTDGLETLRHNPSHSDIATPRRNKSVLALNNPHVHDRPLHTAPIYLGNSAEGYFSFQPRQNS